MSARQVRSETGSPGRERQRSRTRRALLAAAAELVRDGRTPTIAEIAEAADISRATAYRYFPTQDALLAEVSLFAAGGPLEPDDADDALPAADAVARLVRRVGAWAYESESALRTLVRLSLDPASGVRRPGHRVGWIRETLAPVRGELDDETYERLAGSLALVLGIDPVIVMTDIAHLPRERALDTLEWAARTLVESALAQSAATRRRAARARA